MRAAPAVEYPVARRSAWQAACASLAALTSSAVAAWALAWLQGDGSPALIHMPLVLAFAVAGASAGWRLASGHAQRLRWDGAQWTLHVAQEVAEPRAGRVDLMLDLGPWMLLRWTVLEGAPSRRTWVPTAQADAGADWHALRVAVHATLPAGASAGGVGARAT